MRTSADESSREFLTSKTAQNIRSTNYIELKRNPFGNSTLLEDTFGSIARGTDTVHTRESASLIICQLVKACDSETLKNVFADIVKIKESAGCIINEETHRNAVAYEAYHDYIEYTGKEPSKMDLKKFIVAKPEQYSCKFPDQDTDKRGWTRLWEDCGLSTLDDR